MLKKEKVVSRRELAARIKELGRVITADYAGREPLLLGVLNGSFIFLADLVRVLKLPVEIDFIQASSYGDSTCTSGTVKVRGEGRLMAAGRDLLLVEDIVDTGRTIACLKGLLEKKGAASVRICALIDKRERREVEVSVDYAGFVIEEGFLVGYGLDYAGQHRHYPAIYRLTGGIS